MIQQQHIHTTNKNKQNNVLGTHHRIIAQYEKNLPREAFTISFSEKEVDKALLDEYPFGPAC